MAERYNHHRSTFECVDEAADTVIGGQADRNGALFFHVEPRCGSLSCPPYEEQKEMTCAVSTRKNKTLKKHYAVFDLVTFVFEKC